MKKILLTTAFVAAFSLFTACGDEVTEVNEIHQDGMEVLLAGEDFSRRACTAENAGEMLYVTDSAAAFVCDGKTWQTMKGPDGKDGKNGVDGINGKNGEPGQDGVGVPGKDGASCMATTVTMGDSAGVEISCDGTVIDTIWNGAKGADGQDGEPGEDAVGCTLTEGDMGLITVVCGTGDNAKTTYLYKAVCGTGPYEPTVAFCSEGKLYSCNDMPYDPKKQYCLEVTRGGVKIYSLEDLLVDSRDGQVYKTVVIGTGDMAQTWMAENLNYAYNVPTTSWASSSVCFKDSAENCEKYGRLYLWSAAVDSAGVFAPGGVGNGCGFYADTNCSSLGTIRGVCPSGWHLPSNGEWEILINNAGGPEVAGHNLKSMSGWPDGGNGTDLYGFLAIPAGSFGISGFNVAIRDVTFWSSTEGDSAAVSISNTQAYTVYLLADEKGAFTVSDRKHSAYSVRCLKDN